MFKFGMSGFLLMFL